MAKKRSSNKRKLAKSQATQYPRLLLPRDVGGFPLRIRTTLKYSSIVNITSTLLSYTSATLFRCNDITNASGAGGGGGSQPMYRDTYATLYLRYTVLSCKFRIRMLNTDSEDTAQSGYYIDNDESDGLTSARQAREQSTGQYRYLSASSNSKSAQDITGSWHHGSYFGVDPRNIPQTLMSSSPAQLATCVGWNQSGGTSTTSFDVMVWYDVEFAGLNQASLS